MNVQPAAGDEGNSLEGLKTDPASPPECDAKPGYWKWVLVLLLATIILVWQDGMGGSFVQKRPPRAMAQATCMAIYNALDQFFTDYDHLPSPTSAVQGKDWDTDSTPAENVIHILKGRDKQANSRETDYLGDILESKLKDGRPLNGTVLTKTSSALVDPWGNPYLIRLDGDRDGFVADPDPAISGNRIARKAIIWSAGKDGDPKTWKDNVGSWTSANY